MVSNLQGTQMRRNYNLGKSFVPRSLISSQPAENFHSVSSIHTYIHIHTVQGYRELWGMQEVGTNKHAAAAWFSNYYLSQNNTPSLVAVQAPCYCLHQGNIIVLIVSFTAEIMLSTVRDTNVIALVQLSTTQYPRGHYVLNCCSA
jgi:hypothetical protein